MYSVAKAFVAGLALMEGVKAQQNQYQTIYKANPGEIGLFDLPVSCNVSSVFPANESWNFSAFPPVGMPQILQIGKSSENFNFNLSSTEGRAWVYNGGNTDQIAMMDCDEGGGYLCYPMPASLALSGNFYNFNTLCGAIDNQTEVACTIFKAPDAIASDSAMVRIYAKNYIPDNAGFPSDSIVDVQAGKPFSFVLSASEPQNIELIAIPEVTSQATAFLSCLSQPKGQSSFISAP